MARETIWINTANGNAWEAPPEGWEMVHVASTYSFSGYLDLKSWCFEAENPGDFGVIPAIALPAFGRESGSIWAFSDPHTAFAFKLRFG